MPKQKQTQIDHFYGNKKTRSMGLLCDNCYGDDDQITAPMIKKMLTLYSTSQRQASQKY